MPAEFESDRDYQRQVRVDAMTVAGACDDHNVVTMKNLEGELLRRKERYSGRAPQTDQDDGDGEELMQSLMMRTDASRLTEMTQDRNCYYANSSPALRRNVRAWCDATGLPTSVTIRCMDRVFHLHKFPLVSRSGYLKRALKDTTDVTLPGDVPGGSVIFELVSNFCYGSTILMEPANIAELCCASDYFQMTEDYGRANLCERSELYLTQVALQSWDDTLVVLNHCENLKPHAERLGIERRCLDALAFMACMELLDPVARKLGDVKGWWVQDLVALPPRLFVNLVLALRREGMQENSVGQVITAFADQWIFGFSGPGEKFGYGEKCWATLAEPDVLIESVVKLLPLESHVVPIGFLFALLRRGLACALSDECRIQLETRIVLQFESATLDDLLLPGKKEKESTCVLRNELESMERILKLFLTRIRAFDDVKSVDVTTLTAIAKLWDEYLVEIAFDSSLGPARFAELIEKVPAHLRAVHDDVYRAIDAYLKAHPNTTQEERLIVCRPLNCQKLSQDSCAQAVQNELMPLRMIVQAMFMQQLQTRSVLNSHLESATQSFREFPHDASHSGSMILPDSMASGRLHHHSRDSFRSLGSSFRDTDLYTDDSVYASAAHTPAVQLKKEIANQRDYQATESRLRSLEAPRRDYQATESRLRSLEAELSRMRKTLARQQAAASSSTQLVPDSPKNTDTPPLTHSSRLSTPCRMATVHEVGSCSSGCMSQLKPVNRTSHGLLAKTLQKLKLRSFGKSSTAVKHQGSARPSSSAVKDQVISVRPASSAVKDHQGSVRSSRVEPDSGPVARTDSMPRSVVTSQVKPHRHVRRNSLS